MAKLSISNDSILSFGGLNFISSEFDALGLPDLITNHLGSRSYLAKYEYSDIVKTLWLTLFAGGDCAEDVQTNLRSELENIDNLNLCSADTILRLLKDLKKEKEIHFSKAGVLNEFNNNDVLNDLLINVLLKSNQLERDKLYDFDFDNQFIPCEKYDSKKSYKMEKGYFQGLVQ